jgi:hypothetical protein
MSMSKQDRDKDAKEKQTTTSTSTSTSTTTIKDPEELNKRRAANTAPPEEGPEESEEDKKKREASEGTRRGIVLRLKERDGQLNEDETKELEKLNEEEAKAGKGTAAAKKE